MKTLNKPAYLWIIIAFLAVSNIATISTILYHRQLMIEANKPSVGDIQKKNYSPRAWQRMHGNLGLCDKQSQVFKAEHRCFRAQADSLIQAMRVQKVIYDAALLSEHVDTLKLEQASVELGKLHTKMKMAAAELYFALDSVCENEQKTILKTEFKKMLSKPINYRNRRFGNGRNKHRNHRNNPN